MNKYKSKKGISFLTVIGTYGGFHKTFTKHSIHFCLGWIAFTIFFYDVENALAQSLQISDKKQCNIPVVSNCYQLTSKELAKVKEYGTNVVKMMVTGIGKSVSTLNDKNEWVDITDYDSW